MQVRRGRGARRGMVLNTAFACLLLLTMFFAAYFLYVRSQTKLTQNVLAGEKAYHLAQAGVSAAVGYFANTKQPSQLYREILAGRPPAELDGKTEALPPDCEPLQKLITAVRGEASVQVEMTLLAFTTFAPVAGTAVAPDPVEKRGILKITSTGEFSGSKRRIVSFKEVKVVTVLPYVMSKFTLFAVDRAGSSDLNRVKVKKVDLANTTVPPENQHAPLYLKNGAGRNAEQNGWVFLGGAPWKFNLQWGQNKWGDQFQLLKNGWELARASSTATPLPASYKLLLLQRGTFEGFRAENRLFAAFDFDQPVPPETSGDPVTEFSGLLRPYGAPPAATGDSEMDVSPTYVLGRAYRRFMNLRYIKRVADDRKVYLPYAPADTSDPNGSGLFTTGLYAPPLPQGITDPPGWPESQIKNDVFANLYPVYREYMSDVEEQPYNRAADFLDDPQEVDPVRKLTPVRVQHGSGAPSASGFLYDADLNDGNVAIKTELGRELFKGALNQLVSEDLNIPERATFVGDASGFEDWLKRAPKTIPGIVYFRGGDVVIDRPLALKSGGILAVDGSITIAAPITVDPAGQPLSLVSLTGSITYAGTAPVQASLVALRGTLSRDPGAGPLDVFGNVVLGRLSLSELCEGKDMGRIVYDPRLDPTVTGAEQKSYSVQLSPWRTDYQPPAE